MNQPTLFADPTPESVRLETPDLFTELARTVGKCPPGWRWNRAEWMDPNDDLMLVGAVSPDFKSGPKKGRANWAKRDRATQRTVVFQQAQIVAFKIAWERETGRCWQCAGNGTEWSGSGPNGMAYRNCRKCNATGKVAP